MKPTIDTETWRASENTTPPDPAIGVGSFAERFKAVMPTPGINTGSGNFRSLMSAMRRVALAAWRRPVMALGVAFAGLLMASSGQRTLTTVNSVLLDSAPFGRNQVSMNYGGDVGQPCRRATARCEQAAKPDAEQCKSRGRLAMTSRKPRESAALRSAIALSKTHVYQESELARLQRRELAKVQVQICGPHLDPKILMLQTKGLNLHQLVAATGVKLSGQQKEIRVQYLLKTDAPIKITGELK